MSEEFVPEVQESMPQEAAATEAAEAVAVKPAEEIPEAEVFIDDDSKNAIEAAKRSTSAEAKAKRKQAAAHVAERVSREKDEVPSTFFRRSKEAKWYIVHTYSGHENKVKANIEKLVENRGMQDLVLQIIVPTETVVEHKGETSKARERKVFPGYVIVKMIVTNESWYLVRNTQGVTGFVGQGSEPIPLTEEEVRRMGIEKTSIVLDIAEGDTVKVIAGPFKGFTARVDEANEEKQTLKAKVDMFGRMTSVELEYDQVDKL